VTRVVLYSDCPVYGGADRLVGYLLRHEALAPFSPLLVHRSNPDFDAGLAVAVPGLAASALRFPDRVEAVERLEAAGTPVPLLIAAKLAWRLFDALLFPVLVARLYVEFRALRADVVHVNDGGYPGALGCRAAVVAARLAGARAILVVHNQTRQVSLPRDLLDIPIDRLVSACAERAVTATERASASLAERLPRIPRLVIRDGVPAASASRPRAEARRELGLADGEVAWVTTALFEERKGHAVLVEAAALLAARGLPPHRFVLVGDGAERPRIEALARSRDLSGRFLFLGARADARDVAAAGDGFVLPSVHSEDMPLAILDAMALGRAVISTRLAGIPEEVEHGVTGLLAEPGDAAGLADALERLTKDAAARAAMGAAGLRRFGTHFELGAMARAYAELYRETAEKS
jgi:glycosyltransferase involved in cell wall biosynthesis